MKHRILLWLFIFLCLGVCAQETSTVNIHSADGSRFVVYVDGLQRNRTPMQSVNLSINTSKPVIRVVFEDKKQHPVSQSIDMGQGDCAYILRKGRDRYMLEKYLDEIEERTDGSSNITIDIHGNVKKKNPLRPAKEADTDLSNNNDNASRSERAFMRNGVMCASPTLSEVAFMQLKKQVSDEYLNHKKAEIAKNAIKLNCMSAEQVAALVRMLSGYTSEQFEVAKEGYMKMYNTRDFEKVIVEVKNKNDQKRLRDFAMTSDKPVPPKPQDPFPGTPGNQNPGPIPPHTMPSNCVLSAGKFSEALQSIKTGVFEPTKLSQAKLVAKSNCLSVAQIREIIRVFDFENTKLEFAKYAYDMTYEKKDYYLVGQEFTFDNSKTELTEYINSRQ